MIPVGFPSNNRHFLMPRSDPPVTLLPQRQLPDLGHELGYPIVPHSGLHSSREQFRVKVFHIRFQMKLLPQVHHLFLAKVSSGCPYLF